MPEPLDSAIRQAYSIMDIPADRIKKSSSLAGRFVQMVADILGEEVFPDRVIRRMMRLRRYGSERGGLPRLRRRPTPRAERSGS
jgi:hypothetical protein